MPAWAALSAGGIRALVLPREATHVLICADHDVSGVGERAARDAAVRWLAEGRLDLSPLVTHTYSLQNVQTAFETFRDRKDGAQKVVIEFPARS